VWSNNTSFNSFDDVCTAWKSFFLQKKYADNTYRQSFLFVNKHCHAIWQCRNHSSQVGGTTFTYIVVYGPTYVVVLLIVYEHASNPRIYVGNSCYFYVRSTAGYNCMGQPAPCVIAHLPVCNSACSWCNSINFLYIYRN
jgi:hypothetical protein